jgi:putative lipoprotein
MFRVHICCTVAVCAAALLVGNDRSALAQKDGEKKAKVTGTIEHKGEAQFDAASLARVTLQDVSVADDAPPKKLGEQVITELKTFPIAFEVTYDPALIEKGHTYALTVRIESKGKLQYINDTRVQVISGGKETKDVKVAVIAVGKK